MSLCAPALSACESTPRRIRRVHAGLTPFFVVGATHLPFTLRPGSSWLNAKRAFAGSLTVKRNVVPSGGLPAAANLARFVPSRQRRCDCETLERAGGVPGGGFVPVVFVVPVPLAWTTALRRRRDWARVWFGAAVLPSASPGGPAD